MIPMIDVVFLLIIFFLVSSHLAQNETRLPLELPVAVSGEQEQSVQAPRLTINVKDDGNLFLAGRMVAPENLVQRLNEAKQKHGKDVEVRIRCSRAVAYNRAEPIMLACTKAGIWKVTYAVYRKEGS